ncbi:MAG TPA: sulfatase-like hydrolase/transferase [Phycisphaerae bacterium]|nr:sulfatase-like hydrolase/transferase [Phycisphaerae bacterium]
MNRPLACCIAACCFMFAPVKALAADNLPPRPNVILIITDDQGFWDMGANGNRTIETPAMDRLVSQGVMFNRFYCSPVCTPTRAALLTGRHPHRSGAIDTYMGRDVMDASEITLGQVFQKKGYRTAAIGKWHLGRYRKYHPTLRGFDRYLGFWQYGFINRYFDSDELFDDMTPVKTVGYITDVLTDQAIAFLRDNRDHPFLLYLPYNAPHSPYLVPDPYIERYLRKNVPLTDARIYGMVTSIDENVGRLLKVVDELDLADNTIVIFMSDNGGVSRPFKAGLRGFKGGTYEGGIRVPLIIRWPDHFPAGARVDAPAQHIDLFPTLCEIIGAPLPTDRVIDGRSILPLLKTGRGDSPHDYLFHQWCRVRPSPDKSWAVHHGRYKLVNGELFDLQADPGEKNNIAADHPDIVKQLREAFLAWFADVTKGRTYERVPIEVGRPDENPVEIDVTWGEPVGSKVKPMYHNYNRDSVTDWSEPGDTVRWKIDVVRPGRYEVMLDYGCPPDQAGSRFRIVVGSAGVEGTIQPTPGWDVFKSFTVGTFELPKGPAVLEMKPVTIAKAELVRLHKLWLRKMP